MVRHSTLCAPVIYLIGCLYFNAVQAGNRPMSTIPMPISISNIGSSKENNGILSHKALIDEPGFDLNDEDMRKFHIWPSGIIPYYIDDFSFDKVLRDRIRLYLDQLYPLTGLRFTEILNPPDNKQKRWVFFVNRRGQLKCTDHPFKDFTNEGVQKVVLGYDCFKNGVELAGIILSLVGVPPQHNAPDRDQEIKVHRKNILPDKINLFEKLKDDEWLFHDVPEDYDYHSAGHFSLHKYTSNGAATISFLKIKMGVEIGEGNGLSFFDVWKIRLLYNYIAKRKQNMAYIPECKKLFEPGRNLINYQIQSVDKIHPRKKPNRYMLLPEEDATEKDVVKDGETSGKKLTPDDTKNNKTNENESSDNILDDPNLKDIPSAPVPIIEVDIDQKFNLTEYIESEIESLEEAMEKEKKKETSTVRSVSELPMNKEFLHKLMDKKILLEGSDYGTSDEKKSQ